MRSKGLAYPVGVHCAGRNSEFPLDELRCRDLLDVLDAVAVLVKFIVACTRRNVRTDILA